MKYLSQEIGEDSLAAEQVEGTAKCGSPTNHLQRILVEFDQVVHREQAALGLECTGVFERCYGKDCEEKNQEWIDEIHARIIASYET
jgi:hypothetical protein